MLKCLMSCAVLISGPLAYGAGTVSVPLGDCGDCLTHSAFTDFWTDISDYHIVDPTVDNQGHACKWATAGPSCERTDGNVEIIDSNGTATQSASKICESCDDRCSDGDPKTEPAARSCTHSVTVTVAGAMTTTKTGSLKGSVPFALEAQVTVAVQNQMTFGCSTTDSTTVTLQPCKWERSTLDVEYDTGKGGKMEGSFALTPTIEANSAHYPNLTCNYIGQSVEADCGNYTITVTGNVCTSQGSLGADGGGTCNQSNPNPPAN